MENKNQPNTTKRGTKILHVDGDNFFVACEVARFPHLKGKPVIVGEERGIASAMSYEAKALGIHRAMPVFEIREKFPHVAILPAHFELYEQYAENLYQVLCRYSDKVERYSIDECFALLDDDHIAEHKAKTGKDLLQTIKEDAESCLGITLSFGLACTKTLAKIASKHDKPSGCVTISEDPSATSRSREYFLKDTDIGKVWGIGRAISASLTSHNMKTAYDFIKLDSAFVKKNYGEGTLDTWHELQGQKRLEFNTESRVPKSLQSTRSFGKSFNIFPIREPGMGGAKSAPRERSFFLSELSNHAESLCARLRSHKLLANKLSFFLKKNTLTNRYMSREVELGFYTNNASDLCKAIFKECEKIFAEVDETDTNFGFKIKATGISIYQLRPAEAVQDDLFAAQSAKDAKSKHNEVIDSIKRRLGNDSVYLCSSLESRKRRDYIFSQRNLKNKFIYGLPLPYMGEVS